MLSNLATALSRLRCQKKEGRVEERNAITTDIIKLPLPAGKEEL